jgi:ribonuclease Z
MAKIVFLGTSSSIPTKKRDNTSFLLLYKKQIVLIDCPGAVVHKLLKAGIDFKTLQNVIITHQHPDHIYGIVSLIHSQAYLNNTLNIFSNTACISLIRKLTELFNLRKKHYPKVNYINVFRKKVFYQNNGLKISAIKNQHIAGSFGVKVKIGQKLLVYSSDTSFSADILKYSRNADYIIHDCTASSAYFKKHPLLYKMHTCAKDLSQYLKNNGCAKLIPVHFLLLEKGEEKRIRQELAPLRRRVVFVKDFQEIIL